MKEKEFLNFYLQYIDYIKTSKLSNIPMHDTTFYQEQNSQFLAANNPGDISIFVPCYKYFQL